MGLVWLVYPLGVAAVAALRPIRERSIGAWQPTVTVVIATRESGADVLQRVQNCFASGYDPAKLTVVVALDTGEDPSAAADLANVDPRLTVVAGDLPGGKAAALNAGVRAAGGEVLVFADTHQRFKPDAIPRLVDALHDHRWGAASGRLVLATEGGERSALDYYWRMERWLRRNEARVHSTVGVSGAIYALRRDLWMPLPTGLILDDVYVPMRVVLGGHRVGFADAAHAVETRTPDTSHEYRRKVRTLTGVLQLCAWLPGVLIPGRNPIWLQFVFHKLLRLLTPYCMLVIAVAAVAGAVVVLRRYPAAALAAIAVAAAAVLLRPRLAKRLRGLLWQVGVLQAAVVAATFNGLTRRWDVWKSAR